MSHIFISYGKQDAAFVRYLRAQLETEGFDVWFDDELNPGEGWWDTLEHQITGCAAFLVVMSPHSKGSKWVIRELLLAEKHQIPVFPVLLAGDVWANLADLQYADMRKGVHATIPARLLQSLKALYTPEQFVEITIQHSDVLHYKADVAVFKHAQTFYGADLVAAQTLGRAGIPFEQIAPKQDDFAFIETEGSLAAPHALFIGTLPLAYMGYDSLRFLGEITLETLKLIAPDTQHIATTIHGPGFGLDESEALISQVNGYIDALQTGKCPNALRKISIVEVNDKRVTRMQNALAEHLTQWGIAHPIENAESWGFRITVSPQKTQTLPPPEKKTHAYVIMPVGSVYDDLFYYGIQAPVHAMGLLCERVEWREMNDELMRQVMERIGSAKVIIVEASAVDVQVAWQIGYAWGKNRPVVFLANDSRITFPGQPLLRYHNIRDLETGLADILDNLKNNGKL